MSSWGNYDASSNAPYWAAATVNLAPTLANANNMFANTTANAFVSNTTTGLFAVDAGEIGYDPSVAHTGWIKRTVGAGGRAGRVQTEVLVATGILSDNTLDDTIYKDVVIRFTSQPTSNSGQQNGNTVIIRLAAAATPSANLGYTWQVNTGSSWVNIPVGWSTYTGTTSNTLSYATANTANNAYQYRCNVYVTDANVAATNVTSTIVTITVV